MCRLACTQPTNDLDVMTVERLETLLKGWPGCLVLASHDRALLDETATRLLVLQGDGPVRLYDGSYSQVCSPCHISRRLAWAGSCVHPAWHDSG